MESYTLSTAFPNAECEKCLENVKVTKILADAKARTITATAQSDEIIEYSAVEKFIESVKRSYGLSDFNL